MVVVIGELDGDIGVFNYEGSSPRMRGTHDVIAFHALRPGIIPAYAGNTCRNDTRGCCAGDHPRVCGEHILGDSNADIHRGSSPRMRGTRHTRPVRGRGTGIIPAYAGNTLRRQKSSCASRDHPRVCGEHGTVAVSMPHCQGSSPRMRGTPSGTARPSGRTGIIPAYAGNTIA